MAKRSKTEKGFEVLFSPLSSLKSFGLSGRGYSAPLQEELRRRKADLSKDPPKISASIGLSRDGGDGVLIIFVSDDIKAFDLQKLLREQLTGTFKSTLHDRVFVNVAALSEGLQTRVMEHLTALSHLVKWASWAAGKRAKDAPQKKYPEISFHSDLELSAETKCFERGALLAEANNLIRSLAEMPSNILSPKVYRGEIQKLCKKRKIKYEFLGRDALKRLKAGSFLAVIAADPKSEGGIAHLTYKPRGKARKKIAVVGKGLCFDTGGHNIKTGGYMYSMHRDMTGSAVALALIEVLAQMEVPYEVHAFLAIAENMVSPTGYKPNDVVVAMNGTSIEVVDTDAEGRMVLCDTLALAAREKPDLCLDFATLTGSAVRAVGTQRSAVFSNRDELSRLAVEAGDSSGERVWNFPIGQEYVENLKSEVADTLQCATAPGSDHINAATFLSNFITGKVPWVHMDLSCEENKGGLGLVSTACTGYGVRWAVEFLEKHFGV